MVEQRPFKALVVGSSPTQPTIHKPLKIGGLHRKIERKGEPVLTVVYCGLTGVSGKLREAPANMRVRIIRLLCGIGAHSAVHWSYAELNGDRSR